MEREKEGAAPYTNIFCIDTIFPVHTIQGNKVGGSSWGKGEEQDGTKGKTAWDRGRSRLPI